MSQLVVVVVVVAHPRPNGAMSMYASLSRPGRSSSTFRFSDGVTWYLRFVFD